MPTACFAVQPKSFGTFDEHGCDWATDINHAYQIAATYDEDAVIWRCPHQGEPMAWVTVKADEANIEAIASLLFN